MASFASIVVDEASLELLLLENSTNTVWKFFRFPSHDGKVIESDKKKQKHVFCKLYVGNTMNLWQCLEETILKNSIKQKKENKLVNPNCQVIISLKKHLIMAHIQ